MSKNETGNKESDSNYWNEDYIPNTAGTGLVILVTIISSNGL